ncbi:hypothetical protein [Streptomyces celluloflavus]|uniref:hypothetical protein n=1 Tax=Streptomyces celluloflavus TaxID=58344 RepID=UPI003686878C
MAVRAAWLTNRGDSEGGQSRADTRLAPIGTYTPLSELVSLSGVVAGGEALRGSGSGTMELTISAGRAVVQGQESQGAYQVSVTEPVALTFTDGDPQHSRIDAVVLRIHDPQYQPGEQARAALEIIPGTPASDPSEPEIPEACLLLYMVTVEAGASAGSGGINWSLHLSDRRRATSLYSGITPTGAFGREDDFDGAYVGQYRDTGTGLERWNGGNWRDAVERHYVSLYKSGSYNLVGGQYVTVVWDGADAISESLMWTSAQPTRLVAPVDGLYVVFAHQIWPGGSKSARARITVNGKDEFQMSYIVASDGGQGNAASRPLVLRAGDYVEMALFTATAVKNIVGWYSKCALTWQGPTGV